MPKFLSFVMLLALATLPAGCASTGQASTLEKAQYAWSAAIRWGDFEGAWTLVDPAYREAHPMSDLEFARYAQVQISSYRDLAQRVGEGTALREMQVGVINRHTLEERQLRHTEQWRWDAESKTWWVTNGLPDLWGGG